MFTKVDRNTCIACGNCYSICQEVYDCDEEGVAFCKTNKKIPHNLEKDVLYCAEICPTNSIKIIKEKNIEKEK